MVRTWKDGAVGADSAVGSVGSVPVETCHVCGSLQVRTVEPDWFVVELDRSDELRDDLRPADVSFEVEFRCQDCGSHWN